MKKQCRRQPRLRLEVRAYVLCFPRVSLFFLVSIIVAIATAAPLLVSIAVDAATPLCLLKFVAAFLRLAAVLTVAVNCFSKIVLGLVDPLVALADAIARLRESRSTSQQ